MRYLRRELLDNHHIQPSGLVSFPSEFAEQALSFYSRIAWFLEAMDSPAEHKNLSAQIRQTYNSLSRVRFGIRDAIRAHIR